MQKCRTRLESDPGCISSESLFRNAGCCLVTLLHHTVGPSNARFSREVSIQQAISSPRVPLLICAWHTISVGFDPGSFRMIE